VALVLAVLAACVALPLVAVVAHGLATPVVWPLRTALTTLAVAVGSCVAALVPAALVAVAITRVDFRGRSMVWQVVRVGVFIPSFIVPLALLTLGGGRPRGLAAIVAAQGLAFLPVAVMLMVRALGAIPVDLEQAAELLGAARITIVRHITLGLAGPDLVRAALGVLGLCLADVATPLLLGGGDRLLASAIVGTKGGAPAALALAVLSATVALAGGSWRATGGRPTLIRLDRPASAAARWGLGAAAWGVAATLAVLWAVVPVVSLGHWGAVLAADHARALSNSVLLALGAALTGTALALAVAWIVERRRSATAVPVDVLARAPVAVPGVVAGAGYALVLAAGDVPPSLTLAALIAIVACWDLPTTARAARAVLVHVHRSAEEAAVGFGAGRTTTLARIVAPTLRPVAGWILAHVFAGGLLAVGTVVVLAGPGPGVASVTMLSLAATGATGAACAVATVLLALAGGALVLGRAIAGRQRGSSWLV
jgi:iron(III) transport system permease protein